MKNLEISFYNYSLNERGSERAENVLKNFFWQVGEEPENWRQFDGEIEVSQLQSKGGDCFSVKVDENAWNGILLKRVIDYLIKVKDVRYIRYYVECESDFSVVFPYLNDYGVREIQSDKKRFLNTNIKIKG